MVRKQVYIHQEQEILLKRVADRSGTSEAELIRVGLDHVLRGSSGTLRDPMAWERLKDAMARCKRAGRARPERAGGGSVRRRWIREELYDRPVLR